MARYIHLNLSDDEKLDAISNALSSPIRRQIMRLISNQGYNVGEIALKLNMPVSTAAFHVKVLENTGMINTQVQPGIRGSEKICGRKIDNISIDCVLPAEPSNANTAKFSMPIGCFYECKVEPTCGMANESGIIEIDDNPRCFYSPQRVSAQIIWFAKGYLEYRFPNHILEESKVKSLELSFEACSEATYYRNDWPSDITVWINGKEVGTWTSPGDFGGRRGKLNPQWWPDISTQYGLIKTIRINGSGTYIDGKHQSNLKADQLDLENNGYILVRIGVKEDAKHQGGINLFGEKFGDYPQNIEMSIDYL